MENASPSSTETNQKLHWFHKELNVLQWAPPVPSVRDALVKIKSMGHPLHIVTARSEAEKVSLPRGSYHAGCDYLDLHLSIIFHFQPFVLDWLERHDLDNLWDGIHFIGAFQFVAEATDAGKVGDSLAKVDIEQASGSSVDMEARLKEAFLKKADKNGKVAVSPSQRAEGSSARCRST